METKKIIGMLIVSLIIMLAICTFFTTNSYAADSSYVLGITNVREPQNGKLGGAYGIAGLKSDGTPNKKVWKIVSYPNAGNTINYDNAFYCIKAEHGFVSNTSSTDVSTIRKTYDTSFNMKTQSEEVLSRLNAINTATSKPELTQETYNKIIWILDNIYLPKSSNAAQSKQELMEAAGITEYADGVLLTDDDIEVVQQLAIWYFTNAEDSNYHSDNGSGEPTLSEILFNNNTGKDSQYKSFANWYDDALLNIRTGTTRQYQAEDLYRYLISEANKNGNYTSNQTPTSPISLDKSRIKAEQVGERYIIGPLNITVDSNRQYNISELKFKDQNNNDIVLTGENQLLNANKEVVASGDIKDVIGQDFYISLPITTSITNVTFSIKANYTITDAIYYTTNQNTYLQEQPVVLVEKVTKNYEDNATVQLPKLRYLDLALRKSITKINGVEPTQNRLPQVDYSELEAGTDTTAKYNHPKNDLITGNGQFIEYTITVYNEGEKDGYAAEIKDYLPAGIEFVELVSPTDKYSASVVKNDDGTSVITITNTGKNVLDSYTSGIPANESFTIRCKVTLDEGTEDVRLVNIAEITKYYDSESNLETDVDRDSQTENFPDDLKNNSYNGNGQEGEYIPGQQDDDDFEPVIIPGKYFDLSLRKFISAVNGVAPEVSREPEVDVTPLITGESTTAIYNHPKVPLSVKVGDIVTYTIRVYNEGQLDGYAEEITDHLPPQLEFLPDDEDNLANGWYYDETDTSLRTIKTNHLSKAVDADNIIKAFDGETLDYVDITVKCRVKDTATSGEKITNIADITDFADKDGDEVVDRDSEEDNVQLPSDEDLPNYKDEEINRGDEYIPGQEDDDDFEKLQVQIFDLALRKFITAVDDENITNRVPVPTMGEDGNIVYNHTKDPVQVQTNNIVTYTIRVYNEGDIAGYAAEITDDLPEGLLFLPDNELNVTYRWKMIDENGNETQNVEEAVKVTTDYLSKEQEETEGENLLDAYDKELGITSTNPDYRDVKIAFKVIEPNTSDKILTNIAQISEDTDEDGNPVDDEDSTPGNDDMEEDDIDEEHVKLVYFDLALRKFITKVDNLEINNRYPVPTMGEDGNIVYNHTKDPVEVENGDIVTYTIRVYNEGEIAGYASEITDDLPEGLLYLPDNETNIQYRWKMIDSEGNETQNVEEAVKITTDYLSKEQEQEEGANLLKPFDKAAGITDQNPDHRDVKIAFKVTEPNTSDRILINTAEISDDTDEDGEPVDDEDSTPGNDEDGEDDIDIEKVKVKYFDLALKKWVTQAIVIEDGKQTITETGHTGDENPEPVVKVDLKDKKLNSVTVKFKYKIKVTNEGEIDGYVKEIKDHIPEGLKFLPEDNPDWKQVSEDVVATTKLENTLLKPGESATVDIILTWINGDDNLGLKVNIAEISKDYNDSDTPDIDSTPDNFKEGEDDIDDAPVILSIKTGEARIYITLAGIILVTLAGGIFLIKKFVL